VNKKHQYLLCSLHRLGINKRGVSDRKSQFQPRALTFLKYSSSYLAEFLDRAGMKPSAPLSFSSQRW